MPSGHIWPAFAALQQFSSQTGTLSSTSSLSDDDLALGISGGRDGFRGRRDLVGLETAAPCDRRAAGVAAAITSAPLSGSVWDFVMDNGAIDILDSVCIICI